MTGGVTLKDKDSYIFWQSSKNSGSVFENKSISKFPLLCFIQNLIRPYDRVICEQV